MSSAVARYAATLIGHISRAGPAATGRPPQPEEPTVAELVRRAVPRLHLRATVTLLSLLGSDSLREMRACSSGWRLLGAALQTELRRQAWQAFALGHVPWAAGTQRLLREPERVPLPRPKGAYLLRHSSGGSVYGHSAFVFSSGDVFTFGFNACGQLASGDFDTRGMRDLCHAVRGASSSSSKEPPVIDCLAGIGSTVLVDADGGLRGCGSLRPQLMSSPGFRDLSVDDKISLASVAGRPSQRSGGRRSARVPTALRAPRYVKQVGCGSSFSAALLFSGKVYTWGTDSRCKGSLGHPLHSLQRAGLVGEQRQQSRPRRVAGLPARTSRIAVGVSHVLALDEGGSELFTWGGRSYRDEARTRRDLLTRFLWRHRRGGAEAGGWIAGGCAVAGCKREVLACGLCSRCYKNESGSFAHGDHVEKEPGKSSVETPVRVVELSGVRMAQLAAGEEHSAVVSQAGDLFAWGGGPDDLLLGAQRETPAPVRSLMERSLRVLSVECAASYSVVVTVPR